MRDLSLSISSVNYSKKPKTKTETLHLNLAILASVVIIGILYLFQINALGTRGYEIRQLEQKLKALEVEHKHLEVQASSLQSINRIQAEAQKLNFVPATHVTYVKDSDFALR